MQPRLPSDDAQARLQPGAVSHAVMGVLPPVEGAVRETPPGAAPPSPSELLPGTLSERIRYWSKHRGFETVPESYHGIQEDWRTVESDNPFAVLLLDPAEADVLDQETVDRQFRALRHFWTEVVASMGRGTNKLVIAGKYGGPDRSEPRVSAHPDRVERAYARLKTRELRQQEAERLKEGKRQVTRERIQELLEWSLVDKTLALDEIDQLVLRGEQGGLEASEAADLVLTRLERDNYVPEGARDVPSSKPTEWLRSGAPWRPAGAPPGKPDERAAQLRKDAAKILTAEAMVLRERGDRHGALEKLTEAVALDGASADSVAHRGDLYADIKEWQHAIDDYERAIGLSQDIKRQVELRLRCARIRLREGRWADAVAAADDALRRNDKSAQAHELRGQACVGMGKLQDAILTFDRAVALSPRSPARFHRAEASRQAGDLDRAAADFEAWLTDHRDQPEAWLGLGRVRFDQDNVQAAETCVTKATEIDPRHAAAHRLLAAIERKSGRRDAARTTLSRALELDPSQKAAPVQLCEWCIKDGLVDRARTIIELAIARHPGDPPTLIAWACALAASGQFESATEQLSEALRHEKSARAFALRSLLHAASRRVDQAIADAHEATRLGGYEIKAWELPKLRRRGGVAKAFVLLALLAGIAGAWLGWIGRDVQQTEQSARGGPVAAQAPKPRGRGASPPRSPKPPQQSSELRGASPGGATPSDPANAPTDPPVDTADPPEVNIPETVPALGTLRLATSYPVTVKLAGARVDLVRSVAPGSTDSIELPSGTYRLTATAPAVFMRDQELDPVEIVVGQIHVSTMPLRVPINMHCTPGCQIYIDGWPVPTVPFIDGHVSAGRHGFRIEFPTKVRELAYDIVSPVEIGIGQEWERVTRK